MEKYQIPFDTPGAERKIGKLLALGLGLLLFLGAPWMAYDSLHFWIKGKSTDAVVTKTYYFNRGRNIQYEYRDETEILKTGKDHMISFDPQRPHAGDTIKIYYFNNGSNEYLTVIDDGIFQILSFIFGFLILRAVLFKKSAEN